MIKSFFLFIKYILSLIFGDINNTTNNNTTNNNSEAMPFSSDRYALLVGINEYSNSNANLRGCVNDVEDMWGLLVNDFGYDKDNIRVLTNDRATKKNILERLEWLIESLNKTGGMAFFHYSGHGSQIRDRNGDELEDKLDEALCPYELDFDDPLTDDILAGYFKRIPDNAFLIFVCDACHSGSMDRSFNLNPNREKERFIAPPLDIMLRAKERRLSTKTIGRRLKSNSDNVVFIDQKHMLISGCMDNQTSADAFIDGEWNGALTSNLIKSIKNNNTGDWLDIHFELLTRLEEGGFTQTPQISGPKCFLENKVG